MFIEDPTHLNRAEEDQVATSLRQAIEAGDLHLLFATHVDDERKKPMLCIFKHKDMPIDDVKAMLIQLGFGLEER